jgi:Na+-driven multidrug efflux pump
MTTPPKEPTPVEKWAIRLGVFLFLSIPAFFLVAVGLYAVLTGQFTAKHYTTRGFHASVLSSSMVFGGLAWFRAAWLLCRDGRASRRDWVLHGLLWLVILSLTTGFFLLFLSIAF